MNFRVDTDGCCQSLDINGWIRAGMPFENEVADVTVYLVWTTLIPNCNLKMITPFMVFSVTQYLEFHQAINFHYSFHDNVVWTIHNINDFT
jgi:hypothetical protein